MLIQGLFAAHYIDALEFIKFNWQLKHSICTEHYYAMVTKMLLYKIIINQLRYIDFYHKKLIDKEIS